MRDIPPEKYYEACLTYHFVRQFELIGRKLYPFSISQKKEKDKGYDFGYSSLQDVFLIQYKRPYKIKVYPDKYTWLIDRKQLHTINGHLFSGYTYYALPMFDSKNDWYHGLDKTVFVPAPRLEKYLESNKRDSETNIIESDNPILKPWDFYMRKFKRSVDSQSIFVKDKIEYFTDENILDLCDIGESSLWLYQVRRGL